MCKYMAEAPAVSTSQEPKASTTRLSNRRMVLLVGSILLLGAILRLQNLGLETIGHIEIYVPGINLPYELSDPRPRLTLLKTISGTIAGEPHPPGYYILMYVWTKVFGTGPWAIRLPSALFGITSVLLIYLVARQENDRLAAALAAGMLALNGYHIFWSRVAKMYMMATALGLLSTYLLISLWKARQPRLLWQMLYFGATLMGLGTVVFFWPLFLVQMVWVFLRTWNRDGTRPGILRLQVLLAITASPLLAIAAFQAQRASYLNPNPLPALYQYTQFGFLWETNLFDPDPWTPSTPSTAAILSSAILFLLALVLVWAARQYTARPIQPGPGPHPPGPPWLLTLGAGFLTFIGILGFGYLAYPKAPGQIVPILLTSMVPLAGVVFDFFISRRWDGLRPSAEGKARLSALGNVRLGIMLAVLPVVSVAAITPMIPLLDRRTVLVYTPYWIILLATGLAALWKRGALWKGLLIVLLGFHLVSVLHYSTRPHHPNDYKGLAEQWIPAIQPDDLIFTQRNFAVTPIFYYLDADSYHVFGSDYAQAIRNNPGARVWVLSFEDLPLPTDLTASLARYTPEMKYEALRSQATLYVP